jgi:hypothetical protein
MMKVLSPSISQLFLIIFDSASAFSFLIPTNRGPKQQLKFLILTCFVALARVVGFSRVAVLSFRK